MRILLLGSGGQVGWELCRALPSLGDVLAVDYPQIDLARPDALRQAVRAAAPDVIVNAAAYTAVDRAESEPELAMAVNGEAPGVLAEVADQRGAALIHYSTDYVFDGTKGSPYLESDPPNPLSAYGRSKLAGERAVQAAGAAAVVLRTAWVYSLRRPSFVTKVLRWSRQHATLRIVTDQVSNPTWCRLLAEVTAQLLARAGTDPAGWLAERAGLYHLACGGHASRFEWAQAILAHDPHPEQQATHEVLPAQSAEFPTPAIRPSFSALDSGLFRRTFGLALPEWEPALRLALAV